MEIIVLSLVLVVLILLFIKVNMLNQNIDVLMCRVDDIDNSIDDIEENLKTIKENINKLENLCAGISNSCARISNSCASITSDVNSGFSKILNDKSISISLEMTRNIIKDGFNTQAANLADAANMLDKDITNVSDSMAAAHKELMQEIKANKTPKPKTTKNTNKEKKAVNQPENCR